MKLISFAKHSTHALKHRDSPQILTNFKTYFTIRIKRKFVIMLSLKIPPHLKCRYSTLWNVNVLAKKQQLKTRLL